MKPPSPATFPNLPSLKGSAQGQEGGQSHSHEPQRASSRNLVLLRKKRVGAPPLFRSALLVGLVLVATGALSVVPPASAAPPIISNSAITHATTESVTLQATLDPQGKATKYHFEYGPAPCSEEPDPCAALPEGPQLSKESPPVTVSAELEGLSPATTYHFRLLAKNADSPSGVEGPDTPFSTYHLPPLFGPCPQNGAFRAGHPSAKLPDCRAYEQASPTQKNGLDAKGTVSLVRASPAGDRVSFLSAGGPPGGQGAQALFPLELASRAGGNWSTQGLLPPAALGSEAFVIGWTPDFAQVFDAARKFNGVGGDTFLARSSADGSLSTIVDYGQGLGAQPAVYAGASADGNEVLFESTDKLASVGAAIQGKPDLYLWDREDEEVTLAGVLNDEAAPPAGAFAGPYDWIGAPPSEPKTTKGGSVAGYYTQDEKAISPDGASVYFTEAGTGQLYVRRNPTQPQSALNGEDECAEAAKACTVRVSASEKTNGLGPDNTDAAGSRPAAFVQASSDGSAALLTSSEKLTNDANTGPEAPPASIARSNVDGSAKNLSFLLGKAKGVAVDSTHISWADPEDGTIGRAELGGGNPEPEFIKKAEIEAEVEVKPGVFEGIANPQYVAVDAGHIYWTNSTDGAKEHGTIGRAKLDGESPEAEFIVGATNPQGIAADPTYVYWGNAGEEDATRTIGRAELSGSPGSVDQGFIEVGNGSSARAPQGVAVDSAHIYIAIKGTQNFSRILRYDTDGNPSSEVNLFDGQGIEVQGIAVDPTYLYWSRKGTDAIGRIKLSDFKAGSCEAIPGCEPEFIKEAGRPLGLAVDGAHLYWAANQGAPPNPGNDLYRYAANAAAGEHLSDLSVDTKDPDGADVVGVLGASEDLSTVYFAADGDLDGEGPAQAGDCEGTSPGSGFGFSGQCSLYLAREGEPVAFLGRLDASGTGTRSDAMDWLPHGGLQVQTEKTARASANGDTLLFRSQSKLTPYDNEGVPELYRYRVGQGIGCVSCNPTGEAPAGLPDLGSVALSNQSPTASSFSLSRNLSADGDRVFFETTDRLVAEDTNGQGGCPLVGSSNGHYRVCMDAYEWEAQGTGSCSEDVQAGGCLYLLSSGTSDDASYLADASASGNDAFLITRSALVPQDGDQLYDVYDAQLGGGLASQNQPPAPICEAEACKEAPHTPPGAESPGSESFHSPGNGLYCRPGFRKRRGRCVKKHRPARHHKRHPRRAGHNPGGAK